MADYQIITDAACDITVALLEQLHITVIPMELNFGEEVFASYPDDREISAKQFYDRLRHGEVAKTSQVKLNQFLEYFTSVLKEGKDILYISFSSGLSGTYSASLLAAEHLKENFPQSKITCVDTLAASLGEGLLVYTAAKLKEQGKTLEEVQQWLLENRLNLVHLFTVDDLAFLKRGGRCSSLSAFVGTMLHIKPLLHVDDEGKLMPQEKIRTRKKLFEVMVERMAALAIEPEKQVVCISHGDDLAGAETLAELIKNKLGTQDFIINNVCPLVGSHSGPGTIALFFFGRHR